MRHHEADDDDAVNWLKNHSDKSTRQTNLNKLCYDSWKCFDEGVYYVSDSNMVHGHLTLCGSVNFAPCYSF